MCSKSDVDNLEASWIRSCPFREEMDYLSAYSV